MILSTYSWGDPLKPALLCIHGVGGSHSLFKQAAEARWTDHFFVIAVDLRGHGDSSWEPPWDYATMVDDLIDTVDDLGLGAPDWVGLSLGGRLLLELIARHPERVNRAALLEPVIQIPAEYAGRRADQERVSGTWSSLEEFLDSRGNVGVHFDRQRFLGNYEGQLEEQPDGTIRRRTSQSAIVSIFGEFASPSPPPEAVTVPTMILHAPEWGSVTEEQLRAYKPYVERIVAVPGLHSVLTTAFDETTTAVDRFLRGLPASDDQKVIT